MIELGISTFGETTEIEGTGVAPKHDQRIRDMIEEMKLADEVGLDVYAIGEHHREDFAVSAPEILLAAGASVTKNIRLSSAVTVLSSADPVRVYQQYATIDAISNGRSEVMVGRGSFTESFPLFGYDLADYEELFDEKLEMLDKIKNNEKLTWEGKYTQSILDKGVYPRAIQENFPIIGGEYRRFKGLVDHYKAVGRNAGYSDDKLKVASHSWGFIADTDEEAIKKYFHPTKQVVDAISKDRPFWRPLTFEQYLNSVGPEGSMLVGSPETVANKLIDMIETLNLDRFLLHLPLGSMPHEDIMKAIKLFGEEVVPRVRAHFNKSK